MKTLFEEIKTKTLNGLNIEYTSEVYNYKDPTLYEKQSDERRIKNIALESLQEHIRESSLTLKLDTTRTVNIFVLPSVIFKKSLLKNIPNISLVRKKDKADYIVIDDHKFHIELNPWLRKTKTADIFSQIEWEDIPKLISINTMFYDNTSSQKTMMPSEYLRFKTMVASKDIRIAASALESLFDYSIEESCIFLGLLFHQYRGCGYKITNDRPKLFIKNISKYIAEQNLNPLIYYRDVIYSLELYPEKYADQFLVEFNSKLNGYAVSRQITEQSKINTETTSWEL